LNLETLTLPLNVADQAFNTGIKAAVAGVTALVGAMGVAVKATFDWANDLDKLGDVMGGTNKDLAALNFVARKSGVSIDSLSRGVVILEKGLVKADGSLDTTGKALKDFGVDVLDVNGNVKDQTALMGEIAKKYSSFATQQEKVNFLTEIFGRSGAELIDFFDTLAAEGGIDKVAEKVEALGLAIDPNRYEQFNRNLEEMKLIGLGLAVGFTEHIMPAFEAVSKWVMTDGIPALKDFGREVKDAFDKGGLLGVADMLLDKFDGIDWSTVSTAIVDGVNSIDWSQAGIDFSAFVQRVGESIGAALSEFDWLAVGNSLGSGLNNFIAGALFGTDEAGLQTIVQTNLAAIDQEFANWAAGMPSNLDSLDEGINGAVNRALDAALATVQSRLAESSGFIRSWAMSNAPAAMSGLTISLPPVIGAAMTLLNSQLESKIGDIAKALFNGGVRWANQAAAGFLNNMGAVIGAVQTIVDEINAILKKIITSFTFTFNLGGSGGSGGGGNTGGGGGNHPPPTSNGGGGNLCFVAGTLVTLADGTTIPIERVRTGDKVRSWHNGQFISAEVVDTFSHPANEVKQLVVINGKLTATPEHLIYVYSAHDWIAAGGLRVGEIILENGKPVPVTSLRKRDGNEPVYNLHTDHEAHNYFANGYLVHNGKDNARGGTYAIPSSVGWEAMSLGALGTVSGGETVRISPRGGDLQAVAITNWDDMPVERLAAEIMKAANNR
jgi:hypothetical protein